MKDLDSQTLRVREKQKGKQKGSGTGRRTCECSARKCTCLIKSSTPNLNTRANSSQTRVTKRKNVNLGADLDNKRSPTQKDKRHNVIMTAMETSTEALVVKGDSIERKSERKRPSKKRKKKEIAVNDISRIRAQVKNQLHRIRLEETLLEVYTRDGWKGRSREKLRPDSELERARGQIIRSKIAIRRALEELHEISRQGAIDNNLFDKDGRINHEQIFCAKCTTSKISKNNDIILCDGVCNRAFHQKCLEPPLKTSDIPPGDEGWLCPACDCKLDCINAINDDIDTGLSFENFVWELTSIFKERNKKHNDNNGRPSFENSVWEKVFAEDVREANKTGFVVFGGSGGDEWPSDDSEDEDYDPLKLRRRQNLANSDINGIEGGPYDDEDNENDDENDDEDENDKEEDSDEDVEEMLEGRVEEGVGQGRKDGEYLLDDDGDEIDIEERERRRAQSSTQRRVLRSQGYESGKELKFLPSDWVEKVEEADTEAVETLIIPGKRKRKVVDYRKLNEELFGATEEKEDDVGEIDRDWGPGRQKKRATVQTAEPLIVQEFTGLDPVNKVNGEKDDEIRGAESVEEVVANAGDVEFPEKSEVGNSIFVDDGRKRRKIGSLGGVKEGNKGQKTGSVSAVVDDTKGRKFQEDKKQRKFKGVTDLDEVNKALDVAEGELTQSIENFPGNDKGELKGIGGRSRGSRYRPPLEKQAVETLEQVFSVNQLPSKSHKEQLAKKLSLSFDHVDRWFRSVRHKSLRAGISTPSRFRGKRNSLEEGEMEFDDFSLGNLQNMTFSSPFGSPKNHKFDVSLRSPKDSVDLSVGGAATLLAMSMPPLSLKTVEETTNGGGKVAFEKKGSEKSEDNNDFPREVKSHFLGQEKCDDCELSSRQKKRSKASCKEEDKIVQGRQPEQEKNFGIFLGNKRLVVRESIMNGTNVSIETTEGNRPFLVGQVLKAVGGKDFLKGLGPATAKLLVEKMGYSKWATKDQKKKNLTDNGIIIHLTKPVKGMRQSRRRKCLGEGDVSRDVGPSDDEKVVKVEEKVEEEEKVDKVEEVEEEEEEVNKEEEKVEEKEEVDEVEEKVDKVEEVEEEEVDKVEEKVEEEKADKVEEKVEEEEKIEEEVEKVEKVAKAEKMEEEVVVVEKVEKVEKVDKVEKVEKVERDCCYRNKQSTDGIRRSKRNVRAEGKRAKNVSWKQDKQGVEGEDFCNDREVLRVVTRERSKREGLKREGLNKMPIKRGLKITRALRSKLKTKRKSYLPPLTRQIIGKRVARPPKRFE